MDCTSHHGSFLAFALLWSCAVRGMHISSLSPHGDWRRDVTSLPDDATVLLQTDSGRLKRLQRHQFRTVIVPYKPLLESTHKATGLPNDLSIGDLHAYVPTSPANEELHLFLPGSHEGCEGYANFLEEMATHMYTICLTYDNRKTIKEQCAFSSSECELEHRLLAFNGSFNRIEGNNHQERLASALAYLADKDSKAWQKFLKSGKPAWSSIRVSGHSQGAGAAAMISAQEVTSRLVQFAGPCDSSMWVRKLGGMKTPSSRIYGFAHHNDGLCSHARKWWRAEGLRDTPVDVGARNISQVAASMTKGAVQLVLSLSPCDPPGCKSKSFPPGKTEHEAVLNMGGKGPEPYRELWLALMGVRRTA